MTALKRIKKISLLIVAIFFLGNMQIVQGIEKEGKIHKNIYVENIDLSHLTNKEAIYKINKIIEANNEVKLNFNEKVYKLNLDEIDVQYKVKKAVDDAYNVGRKDSFINDIKTKVSLDLGHKKIIKLEYTYSDEKLEKYIDTISTDFYVQPVNATVKIENGVVRTTKEKAGQRLNKGKLKNEIINNIKDIYGEAVQLTIQNIEPRYKESQLSKIDTVLGTYETSFNGKILNRVNNIKIASDATTNVLIGSGEEFSFNSIILNSNCVNKMKEAPVILNGKLEKGLGGGICQVSSTIYNAALYAGMDITSVKNHTIPSAYISKGRDATVSLGGIDFKFKNKFKTPILVYNEVYENRIVSTIYGNKEDKKEIEITTEIVETLPNKVVRKNSEEMYEGEKIVEQDGRVGYKVNTFRIYKLGKDTSKELVYESFYPPKDKVIIHGTKKKIIKKKENIKENNNKEINEKSKVKTEFI